MKATLHITSGDIAGSHLKRSGIPGDIFVWHDILYDGPRHPGWPDGDTLISRAVFLETVTGGGLSRHLILETLKIQYQKLESSDKYERLFLWFDACLFDQSMLAHILTCLHLVNYRKVELICVDSFPGIEPYHGLGQLQPEQLAAIRQQHQKVTHDQYIFAARVDRAFSLQDQADFVALTQVFNAPLPWIPEAIQRWLQEQPDAITGLGHLETLALKALSDGCRMPVDIFNHVSKNDTPPQYWGDITLWAKINGLAEREPPLVRIDGPTEKLPQWGGIEEVKRFRIFPL